MRGGLPSAAGPVVLAALALPAFPQDDPGEAQRALDRRTQEIKEAASPAVVSVIVTTQASPLPRLAFPGLQVAPASQLPERVEGTGFFLAAQGLLVTTHDLVRDAAKIEVRFADGSVRDASLLGTDAPFRMAVLRTSAPASADPLPHAPRVEASESTVAWFLGAVAAAGHRHVATPAIDVQVASVRPATAQGVAYDRFLYAPMSIARGAAGGPLVGGDGRVMGMAVGSLVAREETPEVRMRLPRATLFVRGDDLADAVRQIAATGAVERPMIGVMMDRDTNRVETLLEGSPAEAAGLAEGDEIVRIGTVRVTCYADLTRALLRRRAGDPVKVTVERDGERLTRCVRLAPYSVPAEPTRAPIDGAVLEISPDDEGNPVFTFVAVTGESRVARAGVAAGDRLVTVDGRSAWRFLQRHRARPSVVQPVHLTVERGGDVREIELPQ